MSDYNYDSANNYNYDIFNPGTDSYQGGMGAEGYQNTDYVQTEGINGLRSIATEKVVTKSFVFMVVALFITAFAALITSPATGFKLFMGPSLVVLFIAEMAIVFISTAAIKKNNAILAGILYTVYSFLTGMTFSTLLYLYKQSEIYSAFFATALMFAIMAVIGLTTKKDLTGIGSLCMMGLIGLIIASVLNIFVFHAENGLILSIVGVLIFVGLTAYDTQKIKQMALYSTTETENCLALFGAFQLYLDFINLFLYILHIMSRKK